MKRVAAAVVLLLLAVSTAAAAHFAFNSELTALSDSIEMLIDCAESCSDDELKEKTDRLNTLNIELNLDEKDTPVMDTEPEQENEQPEKRTQDRER